MNKQQLIDKVLSQIVKDITEYGDATSLDEILKHVPTKVLVASLPENDSIIESVG